MSKTIRPLVAAAAVMLASSAARAQDADHWSFTLTPRFQELLFEPDPGNSSIKEMPTYGGSAAIRSPGSEFGLTVTYMGGKKSGNYEEGGNYNFHARRREFSADLEYTPRETSISFLGGYHHFRATDRETLTNPDPGISEANSYRYSINAAELGVRLSSRLGVNSAQTISLQLMAGVGNGRYKVNEHYVVDGDVSGDVGDRHGTGMLAETSIGYNIFLTHSLSVGARARAYVFYVSAHNADPIFALAPEANISLRF